MTDFALYIAVVATLGHVVVLVSTDVRAALLFASLGLVLDVLGGIVLVAGPLSQYGARLRSMRRNIEAERAKPKPLSERLPVWLAFHIGPADVRITSPAMTETYAEMLWAAVLLAIGFACQGLSNVLQMLTPP